MPVIEIGSTDQDDAVLAAFRTVAPTVYANDPVWSPASEGAIDECLTRSADGEIRLQAVVAADGGHPVARAMGIVAGTGEGWVGLFECLPDSRAAGRTVLERCVDWLEATGVSSVVGPRIDEIRAGLLIDGFDRPHTVFTAHNPPFYPEVFRSAGFGVRSRMVSFEFTRERAPVFRQLPAGGITIRSPDLSRLDADLQRIEAFQEEVFGSGPGRVGRDRTASRRLARRLLPLLDLDLVVLAEDHAGDLAGVLICLPDRWQRPPIDRARLVSVAVAPDRRRRRIAMTMGATLVERLLAKGYQTMEGSWIMAGNTRPQVLARALGGTPGRVFALLERGLRSGVDPLPG